MTKRAWAAVDLLVITALFAAIVYVLGPLYALPSGVLGFVFGHRAWRAWRAPH